MNTRIALCIAIFTFAFLSGCSTSYVANSTQRVLAATHLVHHHSLLRHHNFSLAPNSKIYLYGLAYSEQHYSREQHIAKPRLQLARDEGFLQAFQQYFPHSMTGSAGLTVAEARAEALAHASEFLILPHFIFDSAEEDAWKIKHHKQFNLVVLDVYTWKVLDTLSIRSDQFWFASARKDPEFYAQAATAVASRLSPKI